jgi:hypothetical protein
VVADGVRALPVPGEVSPVFAGPGVLISPKAIRGEIADPALGSVTRSSSSTGSSRAHTVCAPAWRCSRTCPNTTQKRHSRMRARRWSCIDEVLPGFQVARAPRSDAGPHRAARSAATSLVVARRRGAETKSRSRSRAGYQGLKAAKAGLILALRRGPEPARGAPGAAAGGRAAPYALSPP